MGGGTSSCIDRGEGKSLKISNQKMHRATDTASHYRAQSVGPAGKVSIDGIEMVNLVTPAKAKPQGVWNMRETKP